MACQLTAAGEAVALLALIDTMHPRIPVRRMSLASRLERLREEGFAYVSEALRRPWDTARREMELRKVERHLARGQMIPLALRDLHLVENFRRVVSGFDPKPWPGRATLFRAERIPYLYRDAGSAYGWDRCAEHGVDIVHVAGDHHTVLLRRNVEPLARTLGAAIERVANAVRFDAD
jgi:thioesterase domain-containing protein